MKKVLTNVQVEILSPANEVVSVQQCGGKSEVNVHFQNLSIYLDHPGQQCKGAPIHLNLNLYLYFGQYIYFRIWIGICTNILGLGFATIYLYI